MKMKIELSTISIQGMINFLEWLKKCPLHQIEISIELFKITEDKK